MKWLILFFMSATANAAEEWFCTEASSRKSDGVFMACGVAEGSDEDMARRYSLKNAVAEFTTICQLSKGCDPNNVEVIPKRTECERKYGVWTCHRLLEIVQN